MFEAVTDDIAISVEPHFLEDESDAGDGRYVWAYTVTIRNHGARAVQLLTRLWRITDARGVTRIVEGEGVVGEQPVIEPGDSFTYTSAAPLATPSGLMVGAYTMTHLGSGDRFEAAVPAFPLDSPMARPLAN